jgi:hypothetical protein
MRRLQSCLVVALGAGLALGQEYGRHRWMTLCVDLPAVLVQGPRAWVAAIEWGPRSRWEGDAAEDRQHLLDACGPAALRAVLRERGLPATQEVLWSICRVRGGGTNLGRLAGVAERFGHPCRVTWDRELDTVRTPAVVHLARGHFVVLERRDGVWARVLDPACGRLRVPLADLRRRASGAVLDFPASDPPGSAPRQEVAP